MIAKENRPAVLVIAVVVICGGLYGWFVVREALAATRDELRLIEVTRVGTAASEAFAILGEADPVTGVPRTFGEEPVTTYRFAKGASEANAVQEVILLVGDDGRIVRTWFLGDPESQRQAQAWLGED